MAAIEELLHRRTALSTFLVHLTRDGSHSKARDNLLAMAEDRFIEERTAFGPAAKHEPRLAGRASQKTVCFIETPLETPG